MPDLFLTDEHDRFWFIHPSEGLVKLHARNARAGAMQIARSMCKKGWDYKVMRIERPTRSPTVPTRVNIWVEVKFSHRVYPAKHTIRYNMVFFLVPDANKREKNKELEALFGF